MRSGLEPKIVDIAERVAKANHHEAVVDGRENYIIHLQDALLPPELANTNLHNSNLC